MSTEPTTTNAGQFQADPAGPDPDPDPFEVLKDIEFKNEETTTELDVYMNEVDAAYAMTPDEFMKLRPTERERVMFILTRQQAGQIRLLLFKLETYEERFNAIATPEGRKVLIDQFMDEFGGGMFKGILG